MTRLHGILRMAAFTSVGLLVFAGALASPLALAAVGKSFDLNWVQLSNIGQAYGAAAAALSALAVAGVAISIRYQARAMHQQRVLASQDKLYERLRMVLDDPETYGPAWGSRWDGMSVVELRRDIFAQFGITHVAFGYMTGIFSEGGLRGPDGLRFLFMVPSGRRYWTAFRDVWLTDANPQARRFGLIADEVFQQVIREHPVGVEPKGPTVPSSKSVPDRASVTARSLATGVAVGGICALAVGWMAGTRRR